MEKMEKRHQDELTTRLEDAFLNGCSYISLAELYCWYDVQKIAALTNRDIESRWQKITNGKAGRLMKVEGRGGIFIFGEDKAIRVDQKSLFDSI